jgi:hypothetical protein
MTPRRRFTGLLDELCAEPMLRQAADPTQCILQARSRAACTAR